MIVGRILIIGGGISGLTAAAAFGQRGVAVDLVEVKDSLRDGGGVGLSIMGNASRALDTIGAAQPALEIGMPADTFIVRRHDGTVIANAPWPPLGKPEWPNQIGISRADFHQILAQRALAAGTNVRCGVTVTAISEGQDSAQVEFSDGSTGRYDLIIAADGASSETRRTTFPDAAPAKYTGLGVWRAYVPRPRDIRDTQVYFDGPHGIVGICPINEADAYIYCILAAPEKTRPDPDTLHIALRELLNDYDDMVRSLGETLKDPALVSYRPLEWQLLPAPWYRGSVVLIGDAAHSCPPNIGQGAAMGIEDAVVMAEEFAKPGTREAALERFMARRWDRAQIVVEASCNIARDQVEHTPGIVPEEEMRRAMSILVQPY